MSQNREFLPIASRLTPHPLPMITPDKFHDECAVFGIYGHKEAANLTYLGLYALQHRGQEASGIVSGDGVHFYAHKGKGLVADIYSPHALSQLVGTMATPRPGGTISRTSSRSRSTLRLGIWRSPITATSSMPKCCGTSSKRTAPSFSPPQTAKSSSI